MLQASIAASADSDATGTTETDPRSHGSSSAMRRTTRSWMTAELVWNKWRDNDPSSFLRQMKLKLRLIPLEDSRQTATSSKDTRDCKRQSGG
jgi:hypothetical protein